MKRLGKKCPRVGVRVAHASLGSGTVTRVETARGKRACVGDLVYVRFADGRVVATAKSDLTKGKGGSKLGDVWRLRQQGKDAPDSGRVLEVQPGDYLVNDGTSLEPFRLPQYATGKQLVTKLDDEWANQQRASIRARAQKVPHVRRYFEEHPEEAGALFGLGVEWTSAPGGGGQHHAYPDGSRIYADEPDQARQVRYQPVLRAEVKPAWSTSFYTAGLLLADAKAALARARPTDDLIPVPEWNSLSSSYVHVDVEGSAVRHKLWKRSDLEQLLAAEDHYRGIMPPETEFRGLGAVRTPTSNVIEVTHVERRWEGQTRRCTLVFGEPAGSAAAERIVTIRFPGNPPFMNSYRLHEALPRLRELASGELTFLEARVSYRITQENDQRAFSVWLDKLEEGSTQLGAARTVTIPAAHLREDIQEAHRMVRELERGIKRDRKALGDINQRRVDSTDLPNAFISTVWEPVDGRFETKVFPMRNGTVEWTGIDWAFATTFEEARKNHRAMVLRWQSREIDPALTKLGAVSWFPKPGRDALDPQNRVVYIVSINGDTATVKLAGPYGAHVQLPVSSLRPPE